MWPLAMGMGDLVGDAVFAGGAAPRIGFFSHPPVEKLFGVFQAIEAPGSFVQHPAFRAARLTHDKFIVRCFDPDAVKCLFRTIDGDQAGAFDTI